MSEDSSNTKPAKPKPANFGSLVRIFLTVIIVLFASQLAAFLALSASFRFSDNQLTLQNLEDIPVMAQLAFGLILTAVSAGLIYLFLRRRGLDFKSIGFKRRPKLSDLWFALLGFGSFYAVLIAATLAISALIPGIDIDQPQNIGFENLSSQTDRLLAFVALVILAPIGEELLWRGYFFSGLRVKLQFLPTLAITSLIFGALHLEFGSDEPLNWMAGIATLTLAAVLAVAREKTAALYSPMLIHTMNNGVAFIIVFL